MPDQVLTKRDLNRATLARQLLLERAAGVRAEDAVVRLAGLQAQALMPPHLGLWARLEGFEREELVTAIEARRVVRGPAMRHTLHLLTAGDFAAWRLPLQGALTKMLRGITGKRLRGVDIEPALAAARELLATGPRGAKELREAAAAAVPDADESALGYAVRTFVPMLQVPGGGAWGFKSSSPYQAAEQLLGRPLEEPGGPHDVVRRYLAAFGPGRAADAQQWSGLTALRAVFDDLRGELRTFRDEDGRELFDVPDGPLPGGDAPAPVRLLPEFDNLVLSHADRTRVLPDEVRPRVLLNAARVRATFLVDGFVAGTWRLETRSRAATLTLEPFGRLARGVRAELRDEAERAARFAAPEAASVAVEVESP